MRRNIPTALIGEAITQASHVIANGRPFRATDDPYVLYRQNRKEQILVGSVVPILAIHDGFGAAFRRKRYILVVDVKCDATDWMRLGPVKAAAGSMGKLVVRNC